MDDLIADGLQIEPGSGDLIRVYRGRIVARVAGALLDTRPTRGEPWQITMARKDYRALRARSAP